MRWMQAGTSRRRGLLGAVASVLALALLGGSAQAAVYQQTGSFAGFTEFMDIRQSDGTVYTTNASPEIKAFDAAGTPLSPFATGSELRQLALDNSGGGNAGRLYVMSGGELLAFDSAGNPTGTSFSPGPASSPPIAVGIDGNIYFPNVRSSAKLGPDTVEVRAPNGTLQQTLDCSDCPAPNQFGRASGVAVDSKGNLYVSGRATVVEERQRVKIDATGGVYSLVFEGQSTATAGTGDLTEGSTTVENVVTTSGQFTVGKEISGAGIPAGTTISSVGEGTLELSEAATASATGVSLSAAIPLTADATIIRNALAALPAIGATGNVAVSGSLAERTVTFTGALKGVDVPEMTIDTTGLTGGSGTVETFITGANIPGRVIKYDSNGENPIVFALGSARGLTVNRANDTVFVAYDSGSEGVETHVVGYDSAGNQLVDFGLGTIGGGFFVPLSVNWSTGTVYAGDMANEKTWIFTLVQPTATTSAPSSLTQTSATLNGTVNPNDGGDLVDCHFSWGTTTAYTGGTVPCASIPPDGNSAVAVSGDLSGLSANTTYHYKLVVDNGSGPKSGADQQFTTLPLAPIATTGAASAITASGATLGATVNPKGAATTGGSNTCRLEWGPSAGDYSTGSALCSPSPSGANSNVAVTGKATGLAAKTTYHYRVVVTTAGGTANGNDAQFTTLANAPSATTEAASGVSQSAATLNAKVDANGDPADCSFEYGTSSSYGSTVSCSIDPVTGEASTAVSASLSGLSAGTTYHYRVVAENAGGKASGADMTFTTNAAPAPPAPTPPAAAPPPPPPAGDNGAVKQACIAKAMKAFKKAKKAAAKKKGKAKAKAMQAATKRKAKAIKQCNAL
jgi:hypothetical protein